MTTTTIDAGSISKVADVLGPERDELLALLGTLDATQWGHSTECPEYSVQGIATHILGDDLSLLSRQRDAALPGLFLVAEDHPGAEIRELLNAFNDQWVKAARFFSPALLIELLRLAGEWTSSYYRAVDPNQVGEPVPLFSPSEGTSPMWQAIAREYLERWAHHSQIRRALGMPSLADAPFLEIGATIVATVADAPLGVPTKDGEPWTIGPVSLGPTQQAADILTLAYTSAEVSSLLAGPDEAVEQLAARTGRR